MSPEHAPYRADWPFVVKNNVRVEFMLGQGEDIDTTENIDVTIEMPDGRRWGATMLTLSEVARILDRWGESKENVGGLYLRMPDLIVMRRPGLENMMAAILDLVEGHGHQKLTPVE